MKLDLLLEHRGHRLLFAWARETQLGIYMSVRFSPAVENVSYFHDGLRQLLRFTSAPDGTRRREEIPLDRQPPIPAIRRGELILARVVDLSADPRTQPSVGPVSAGTTVISIGDDYLGHFGYFIYEAHIARCEFAEEISAEQIRARRTLDSGSPFIRIFPMNFYPEHALVLLFGRAQSGAGDF